MKQQITVGQFNELIINGSADALISWAINRYPDSVEEVLGDEGFESGSIFLPNIGQMIEFLDEHKLLRRSHWENDQFLRKSSSNEIAWSHESSINSHDICDNLWESVKEELEKE